MTNKRIALYHNTIDICFPLLALEEPAYKKPALHEYLSHISWTVRPEFMDSFALKE